METQEAFAADVAHDDAPFQPGVWCEKCNKRLVELKRQTLKLILPELNNVIQFEGSLHRVRTTLFSFLLSTVCVSMPDFQTWVNVIPGFKISPAVLSCAFLYMSVDLKTSENKFPVDASNVSN